MTYGRDGELTGQLIDHPPNSSNRMEMLMTVEVGHPEATVDHSGYLGPELPFDVVE
jgi:hypothetical protein